MFNDFLKDETLLVRILLQYRVLSHEQEDTALMKLHPIPQKLLSLNK